MWFFCCPIVQEAAMIMMEVRTKSQVLVISFDKYPAEFTLKECAEITFAIGGVLECKAVKIFNALPSQDRLRRHAS